jgi:hypothetical protein
MSEKVDKQIEKLVEKAMTKSALESPSSNFTAMVMKQVYASYKSEVTVYKPLISKPMWFAIAVVTILLVSYIIFGLNTAETGWLNFIDLSILTDNKLSNSLSEFKVSKTVLYSVVMFSIMLFIQVPILKNYFNKRLAV